MDAEIAVMTAKGVDRLAAERDALLAAARGVLPLLEGFEHDAGRGHLPSVEALRTAIAQAEGR